nr:MAG TPA: hypothetical protein [Caudoviricetes sp.]
MPSSFIFANAALILSARSASILDFGLRALRFAIEVYLFCISLSLSVSIFRPEVVVLSWTTLQRYTEFLYTQNTTYRISAL